MLLNQLKIAASRSVTTEWTWQYQMLLLFLLTLFTRLPFRSTFLFDQDSVQFALGMKTYDVYLHQPHPPGYFLYVELARLIDVFVQDANASLVWISVFASVLAVLTTYCLASAIVDRQDGKWAALLMITSPAVWFHSEVALTYIVAAFFANLIGFLSWRMLQGDRRWLYASPVVLAIAAGFRQDLILFLGPLWFFAATRFGWRDSLKVVLLLVASISLWFIPMVAATGGLQRYLTALMELWQFNNDSQLLLQSGVASRADTLWTLAGFLFYGVEVGAVFLMFSAYLLLRTGQWRSLPKTQVLFFTFWLAPALLFFSFVFIPPYKYSYGLVVIPAFILLIPQSVRLVAAEFGKFFPSPNHKNLLAPYFILPTLVAINAAVFCLWPSGFSVTGLRNHERILATIIAGIERNFPSNSTLILGRQRSTFSGFRHIQHYLPEYAVYLADQQTNLHNEKWHAFGARRGETILANKIIIPPGVRYVVFVADPYFPETSRDLATPGIDCVPLNNEYALYYKDLSSSAALSRKGHGALNTH
jgi:hypothetical protein